MYLFVVCRVEIFHTEIQVTFKVNYSIIYVELPIYSIYYSYYTFTFYESF